jgi:hypothetical protein
MITIVTNIVYTIEFHRKLKTDIWSEISLFYIENIMQVIYRYIFLEYYNMKYEKREYHGPL